MHAPLDAPQQRRRAVMLEVDARLLTQKGAYRDELLLDSPPSQPGPSAFFGFAPEPQIIDNRVGDRGGTQHMIDAARSHRLGAFFRSLHHRHAAGGPDRLDADEAVRSFRGKDDADGARTEIPGDRTERGICRETAFARVLSRAQSEPALPDSDHGPAGRDIKMAGQDRPAVDDRCDRKIGEPGQGRGLDLAPVRACPLNDDASQTLVAWKRAEKLGQSGQAVGRSGDRDDERLRDRGFARLLARLLDDRHVLPLNGAFTA